MEDKVFFSGDGQTVECDLAERLALFGLGLKVASLFATDQFSFQLDFLSTAAMSFVSATAFDSGCLVYNGAFTDDYFEFLTTLGWFDFLGESFVSVYSWTFGTIVRFHRWLTGGLYWWLHGSCSYLTRKGTWFHGTSCEGWFSPGFALLMVMSVYLLLVSAVGFAFAVFASKMPSPWAGLGGFFFGAMCLVKPIMSGGLSLAILGPLLVVVSITLGIMAGAFFLALLGCACYALAMTGMLEILGSRPFVASVYSGFRSRDATKMINATLQLWAGLEDVRSWCIWLSTWCRSCFLSSKAPEGEYGRLQNQEAATSAASDGTA